MPLMIDLGPIGYDGIGSGRSFEGEGYKGAITSSYGHPDVRIGLMPDDAASEDDAFAWQKLGTETAEEAGRIVSEDVAALGAITGVLEARQV